MGRLIRLNEIDEFSSVNNIPDTAINTEILNNVRNLDEKDEIEKFIREIIYDPNETPHGPTEIADILTSHVHIRGNKKLAGFVLKGKSFKRVSSREVTHQFAKLRQIEKLDLTIFAAVGDIQDDAQRDFIQTASDGGYDYIIIDVQNLARLLIAYEIICPKDGTPYDNMGLCKKGHLRDKGLTIEMKVKEKKRYTIVRQRDVSHAGAKRYSAFIILDKHYSKDIIRTIIQEATEKLKHSNYYRNEQTRIRWGKNPANVVWLFIACDLEDIQNVNWVCRTCWVDNSLPKEMQPMGLNGNEEIGHIEVAWNDDYKSRKEFFEKSFGTKEEVLEAIFPILEEMTEYANRAIDLFEKYELKNISEDALISEMQRMEPRVSDLYYKSGNIPMPPEDCKDFGQACQSIFGTIDNMFLFFSKTGLEKWPKKNRDWLMRDTIERFQNDYKKVKFEEGKIH